MEPSPEFERRYILTLSCPDKIGIVAAVSSHLVQQDCNILDSAQFFDVKSGRFFLRTVFAAGSTMPETDHLAAAFRSIAGRFDMDWELHDAARRAKAVIMVSKPGHCLNDLLYRVGIGALAMDVVAIVSNHPDHKPLADFHGVAFHHMPVTTDTRREQEDAILSLVDELGADLVVLARYMQILTPDMCRNLRGRAINIHHSFLPGFKGASPYRQAHARGVKLIGATAHYVTPDLDEGPIIEQETARVTHAQSPADLERMGRDLENMVLSRAVRYHIEHRVLMHQNRTIVFS